MLADTFVTVKNKIITFVSLFCFVSMLSFYWGDVMTIGERIKSLRMERGLTQKELSNLSSLSEISIRKYESGDRQPKQNAIFKLAKALDVSEGWLMGFDVPMERIEENNFLADQSKELTTFIKYLETLKYIIRFEKDVQEYHSEEMNGEQVTVGDSETFNVTVTKDKMTVTFSESEFEDFMNTINKSIEFEIFKAGKK
jgi:transcriptional regulator with XRE-family HTH domain